VAIKTSFWRSAIVKYAIVSLINLAILLAGIAIGVTLAPHIEQSASANNAVGQSDQQSPQPTAASKSGDEYEEVTPMITAGSMATGTLLAHRIATDQIMVNGYDLAALDEGLLNLLKNKNLATFRELDAVIERAKVPHPIRLKLPQSQPPASPNTTPEQKKP
jgi:hypothetical protein